MSDPKWRGGQGGSVPLPPGSGDPSSPSYSFVQLADSQFGMMAAMRRAQWQRLLCEAVTCGRLSLPPRVASDLSAPAGIPRETSGSGESEAASSTPAFTEQSAFAVSAEALEALELSLASRCVAAINAMDPPPAFVAACGDLVHAFPNDRDDDGGADHAAQVATFKRVFGALEPPLVCLCGNHDVGERPTPKSLSRWRRNFGKDHFAFTCGPDKYLVLNSQLYKDGSKAPDATVAQAAWLELELGLSDADCHDSTTTPTLPLRSSSLPRFTTAFSHIPPFIFDPFEADGYFPLARRVRLPLLTNLARGGVGLMLCGHYHRNAGGIFRLNDDEEGDKGDEDDKQKATTHRPTKSGGGGRTVEVVTTAAVGGNITMRLDGGDPLGLTGMGSVVASSGLSGIRVVKVTPQGITHAFKSLNDLEAEARTSAAREDHAKAQNLFL